MPLAHERGSLAVADPPEHFGGSPKTIRRDLRRLEEDGQIVRAYGSIRAVDFNSFETGQQTRAVHSTQKRLRIAAEAVARIGRARTIVIDEAAPARRPGTTHRPAAERHHHRPAHSHGDGGSSKSATPP